VDEDHWGCVGQASRYHVRPWSVTTQARRQETRRAVQHHFTRTRRRELVQHALMCVYRCSTMIDTAQFEVRITRTGAIIQSGGGLSGAAMFA